jgi:hypothetical protein
MIRIQCVLPNTMATIELHGSNTALTSGHVGQQFSVDQADTIKVDSGAVLYTDEDGFLAVVAMGTRKTLLEVYPIPAFVAPEPAPEPVVEAAPEAPAAE